MIKTKGIVHFSLAVSDIARSARFFEEILGVEVLEARPAMAFLKTGDDCFALVKSKTPIDPNPGDEHHLHHAFWVDAEGYDDAVRQTIATLNRLGEHDPQAADSARRLLDEHER